MFRLTFCFCLSCLYDPSVYANDLKLRHEFDDYKSCLEAGSYTDRRNHQPQTQIRKRTTPKPNKLTSQSSVSYQRHRRLAFVEMMKAMIHLFTNAWAFEALLRITCFRFACSYCTFCHPWIDEHHDHLVVLNVLIQGTYAHPNPCGFGKRLWSFVVTV